MFRFAQHDRIMSRSLLGTVGRFRISDCWGSHSAHSTPDLTSVLRLPLPLFSSPLLWICDTLSWCRRWFFHLRIRRFPWSFGQQFLRSPSFFLQQFPPPAWFSHLRSPLLL